jgi:hypothetical protein
VILGGNLKVKKYHLFKNGCDMSQSGFLLMHSSVHQLIELYNTILNSLEQNFVASVFVISQRLSIKFVTKV